jgi:anti-anti-sigma factor
MAFFVEREGDCSVVFLEGEVDATEMDRIVAAMTELCTREGSLIEVDMSRLSDLGWEALGKLVEQCLRARKEQTTIRVRAVSPGVDRTIQALGTADFLGMGRGRGRLEATSPPLS